MNQKSYQIIFQMLLIITLFSYWAGFALLVVNKWWYRDLPGYTIGRICIWEFVAIIVAALIARLMIRKWGNVKLKQMNNELKLTMHPNFGLYFAFYFLIAVLVGIWQFWMFSQQF